LRRRVQADPASIAFAALAEEFRRIGRYDEAIETCRTGLQRHPAYLSARVTLGRALIETGDYDGAREELETVLRSAPENLAAIRGLEQISERLGHSTEMHPDLHAITQESIRLAPPPPPLSIPEPPPPEPPSLTLSLDPEPDNETDVIAEHEKANEPFDIFAAALQKPAPQAPPTLTFEPATIAFEAPVLPPFAPSAPDASADTPEPHVAAAVLRLERFLDAIQAARHA
jgi:tetratricopeptide (TPR) repeat protein